MTMDDAELGETLGRLASGLEATNKRFTDHMEHDSKIQSEIFRQLKEINDTLSQATGARKILVWIIATTFAGIALAKGWLWKP